MKLFNLILILSTLFFLKSNSLIVNGHCNCIGYKFKPVCAKNGITYKSPCFLNCARVKCLNYKNKQHVTLNYQNLHHFGLNKCNKLKIKHYGRCKTNKFIREHKELNYVKFILNKLQKKLILNKKNLYLYIKELYLEYKHYLELVQTKKVLIDQATSTEADLKANKEKLLMDINVLKHNYTELCNQHNVAISNLTIITADFANCTDAYNKIKEKLAYSKDEYKKLCITINNEITLINKIKGCIGNHGSHYGLYHHHHRRIHHHHHRRHYHRRNHHHKKPRYHNGHYIKELIN
jgi:hypothetical protein